MPAQRIHLYVAAIAASSVAGLMLATLSGFPFPGFWALSVLICVGFLLEISATTLRGGEAEGSLSFVVHLSAGILFGALWGGVVAAITTALGQVYGRRPTIKLVFNVAQRTVALVGAMLTYQALGGRVPPGFLVAGSSSTPREVVTTVVAFFAGALAYFLINSLAVSGALAITRGRSIKEIWKTNTLWVLGYDLGASTLALVVAWLYLFFEGPDQIARLGFVAIFIPIIGAKHIYSKLNRVQRLYDELDAAYAKLELNVREQLEMMVRSIEARDPYTSGHSRRVAALSKAIAQEVGLDEEQVSDIETAALLHDVGKIHAEFAPLLSKEGRLTEEEWEIMKTHATKSAELVGLFSRFQGSILSMVRHHHERWDGKGYPDGVSGDAIPFGARIIMISDTIDAMSTDRPYRKALSFEKVVAELLKFRAVQFAPDLVDVTINSVTVRRLVSDKEFLAEQTAATLRSSPRPPLRPALRSQKSFWEGLRAAATQDS
jgi:putative nucleotidyltransferase with HDIG domain